jgi:hypothetical protein
MNLPAYVSRALLPLVLAGGTLFSWYNTALLFKAFYVYYPSVFMMGYTLVPNPLLTSCFYGAVAFACALVWSLVLALTPHEQSSVWLRRFLVFGVCFASVVLVYEALEYYEIISLSRSVSCSPGVHPFKTPCFGGLVFFIGSYLVARYVR